MNKWARQTVGSGQTKEERSRVLDGYHTPRIAVERLLEVENLPNLIWEPANGFGGPEGLLEV